MVLAVCRRVLRNEADAEDAFQATFLVLVRKGHTVRPRALVGNWLYGVAHNVARKARSMNNRRRLKESEAGSLRAPAASDDGHEELRAALDEELSRLPARYRLAIVLCDLEGRTIREVAEELILPQGTVAGYLTRGRALLVRRLTRRGLAVAVAGLPAVLGSPVSAGLPPTLATATLESLGFAGTRVVVAPKVAALAEGVLKTMFLKKLSRLAALVLLVVFVGLGTALALPEQFPQPPVGVDTPDQPPREPLNPALPRSEENKDRPKFRLEPVPAKELARQNSHPFWHHDSRPSPSSYEGQQNVLFSPDGTMMASIEPSITARGPTYTIRLQDTTTLKERHRFATHHGRFETIAFSPDGKTLGASQGTGVLRWDTATGKELTAVSFDQTPGEQTDPNAPPDRGAYLVRSVHSFTFSPDSKSVAALITAYWSTHADLRQPNERAQHYELRAVDTGKILDSRLNRYDRKYELAGFASDGKLLVWEAKEPLRYERLVEADTLKERLSFRPNEKSVSSVMLSLDGRTCFWTSHDQDDWDIRQWEVGSGKEIRRLKRHTGGSALALTTDERTLASAGGGIIKLWDAKTGEGLRQFEHRTNGVAVLAFSPDGKTLAVGGMDGVISIWDATTGKLRQRLPDELDEIRSTRFSPDGTPLDRRCTVRSLRFSPDGTRILAGMTIPAVLGSTEKLFVWQVAKWVEDGR
jgi:RNA polymerase sigma factor (sigma-70 family)